jgi:branched-subunit amino acid aminotransferase/4-amino-4-deoxychorismate lyase
VRAAGRQDTVCTAPTDVVLAGTFRSLVLEVCAENHIPISLHCPQVSTIDRWQSVFITSTTPSAFL